MDALRDLDLDLPLLAAPMAGGPSTPELVAAAAEAGGAGFLAGGYKTPSVLAEQITRTRELLAALGSPDAPFGVNLFVPAAPLSPQARAERRSAVERYAAGLTHEAAALGLDPERWLAQALDAVGGAADDAWASKIDLLATEPVPLVSFTFNLPPADVVARLRDVGTLTLATVTTPQEALAAQSVGVDALVVQGPHAGGHSATWDPGRPIGDELTAAVLRAVLAEVGLPAVAAGGVSGPDDVAGLLDAGAAAVAVGTLLVPTAESGASPLYKRTLLGAAARSAGDEAVRDTVGRAVASQQNSLTASGGGGGVPGDRDLKLATRKDPLSPEDLTAVTRAFTGRPARGLVNGFMRRHGDAPGAYPEVHHATRALRSAAWRAGDGDRVAMWAGTGAAGARGDSVVGVLHRLAAA